MALPLAPGLTPSEVAFLCEMEMVTVVPGQRLDGLELLGGPTKHLKPPLPTPLPLWLALLLKRQKRANIKPPPWMTVDNLSSIYEFETDDATAGVFSPPPELPRARGVSAGIDEYLSNNSLEISAPFIADASTSREQHDALPYHWLELSHILLTHAPDDFDDADAVRRLIRDLREVRMSKLRKGLKVLGAGAGIQMNGVGAMEVAEVRTFITSMVDQLRRLNRSREESRKEEEEQDNGYGGSNYQNGDDEMEL